MQNTQKSKRYENNKCYYKIPNAKNIGKEIAYFDNKPMLLVGLYNDITDKGYGNTNPTKARWICNAYGWYFYYEAQGGK
tara:strand:- start:1117 stop:1353 length:237 start_codon:yes stop_codon:yes gene_type:complete